MVEMVLLSRASGKNEAMESLVCASYSMGPLHGSWRRTSSSTSLLGNTSSVKGPAGPQDIEGAPEVHQHGGEKVHGAPLQQPEGPAGMRLSMFEII